MKGCYRLLAASLLSFLLISPLWSQLVINEYSASNKDSDPDNYGEYEDWVELYNAGGTSVSLGGYFITDNPLKPDKWPLPAVSLPAGGHVVIWCSSRDEVVGSFYHTNFKLTQCKGEKLFLNDAALLIVDSVTTKLTQKNHSRGRKTDGGATWGVFTTATPGNMNTGAYTEYASKPTFSLPPGFLGGPSAVSLAGSGGTIRYTTDGSEPTAASTAYSSAIPLPAGPKIIRAKTFSGAPDILPSFTETNSYFVGVDNHNLAVVSISSADFSGLFSSSFSEIMSSFEYFDPSFTFRHEGDGDFRPHGNDSWAFPQKGIRFYARDDYGYANNIENKLFNASPRTEFDVIILKAGASDNYPHAKAFYGILSTHLRDVFAQTLSQKHDLNLDERSWEPCQLYLNGQYWGLYEIRERIDTDYADFYYDQDPDSVDMLAYWGGLTLDAGTDTAWNNLYDYMITHDLSIPANYDYVDERFEVMSLIDYFILNTYLVNTDWLNWNTAWWRGNDTPKVKWRYRLWDEDNILNLGENYTGVSTPTYTMDPCEPTSLFPGDPDIPHTDMINALDANPDFHNLYISRYADLLNTTYHCDTLNNHLDWILSRISPEMPNQTARWGGSVADWNDDLDSIRVQIDGRCVVVDSLMAGCYALTGPYNIIVNVMPPSTGNVKVNTIIPSAYPWNGDYFGTTTMNFAAMPFPGYKLDHWDFAAHTPSPTFIDDSVSILVSMPDTITAYFIDTALTAVTTPGAEWNFRVYPVPVTDRLMIEYGLNLSSEVDITLWSTTGVKVAEILHEDATPGSYRREYNLAATGLPAGVYFVRLQGADYLRTQKIVYVGQ